MGNATVAFKNKVVLDLGAGKYHSSPWTEAERRQDPESSVSCPPKRVQNTLSPWRLLLWRTKWQWCVYQLIDRPVSDRC